MNKKTNNKIFKSSKQKQKSEKSENDQLIFPYFCFFISSIVNKIKVDFIKYAIRLLYSQ